MTANHVPAPAPTRAGSALSGVKRRAYMAYFAVTLVGALALGLVLPLLDPATSGVAFATITPTVAFVAICFVVLWRRPDLLRVVEVAQYAAYYAVLVGLLALLLSSATTEAARFAAVASFAVWVPAVFAWSFIVFGSRGGPYGAFAFLAAAGVVVAAHLAGGEVLGATGAMFVIQAIVASTTLVVLLYALSHLLERQTASRIAAEVAAEYAVKDVLTGVFTRFALGLRFDHALALAHRTGRRLAVALVDLDGFKRVNDDLGHAAGDEVLRELAARITAAVRDADTVARLGGDEFVMLAFVDDSSHAVRLAERLITLSDGPFLVNGLEVDVGTSVGVSIFPDDAESAEALLASADAAMYAAKATGKRRVALASQATAIPT